MKGTKFIRFSITLQNKTSNHIRFLWNFNIQENALQKDGFNALLINEEMPMYLEYTENASYIFGHKPLLTSPSIRVLPLTFIAVDICCENCDAKGMHDSRMGTTDETSRKWFDFTLKWKWIRSKTSTCFVQRRRLCEWNGLCTSIHEQDSWIWL